MSDDEHFDLSGADPSIQTLIREAELDVASVPAGAIDALREHQAGVLPTEDLRARMAQITVPANTVLPPLENVVVGPMPKINYDVQDRLAIRKSYIEKIQQDKDWPGKAEELLRLEKLNWADERDLFYAGGKEYRSTTDDALESRIAVAEEKRDDIAEQLRQEMAKNGSSHKAKRLNDELINTYMEIESATEERARRTMVGVANEHIEQQTRQQAEPLQEARLQGYVRDWEQAVASDPSPKNVAGLEEARRHLAPGPWRDNDLKKIMDAMRPEVAARVEGGVGATEEYWRRITTEDRIAAQKRIREGRGR